MINLPSFELTPIPGLLKVALDIRKDDRGWFEEVWHQDKWRSSPLASFSPKQQNASFNNASGSTRGFHAEPWNKFVTVVSGLAFCAWLDLRNGESFGQVYFSEVSPGEAYFVPAGVANAYQSVVNGTSYVYLVDDHWHPDVSYPAVNVFDESLKIPWPFSSDQATVSQKDLENPLLRDFSK